MAKVETMFTLRRAYGTETLNLKPKPKPHLLPEKG